MKLSDQLKRDAESTVDAVQRMEARVSVLEAERAEITALLSLSNGASLGSIKDAIHYLFSVRR